MKQGVGIRWYGKLLANWKDGAYQLKFHGLITLLMNK
jgi:hypothetical protein